MTTIYDSENLRVTLSKEGDRVEFWNYDELLLCMTTTGFDAICRVWINPPQPN